MKNPVLPLLASVLVGAACANDGALDVRTNGPQPGRTVEFDRRFSIGVHESVLVEGTHVLVFFDRVSEDSRCPTGVECPWEGNAAVVLEVSLDNAQLAPQPVVLNTDHGPREADRFGVTIRLEELAPHPHEPGPAIDPESYVAELLVSSADDR